MLVELGLVEQRYQAVLEVLNDGASVTDAARRYGVARQTVHDWLRRYAAEGLRGLADRSSRPLSCPHQMDPVMEARIVDMRRAHPAWGPRTILFWLEREGITPLPGRTSVERCLIRHGLVTPQARRRKRSDYRRWERGRSMELWQMDIVGGVRLVDGSEASMRGHKRFRSGAWRLSVFAGVDPDTGRQRYVYETVHAPNNRAGAKAADARLAQLITAVEDGRAPAPRPPPKPDRVDTGRTRCALAARQPTAPGPAHRAMDRLARCHSQVRALFSWALRKKLLAANPALSADPPRLKPAKLHIPSMDDLRAVQAVAPAGFAAYVQLAATVGARRGALVALRWGDLDLEKGSATFTRAIAESGYGVVEKGTKADRPYVSSLGPSTVSSLQAHRQRAIDQARRIGTPFGAESFVFSDDGGLTHWNLSWPSHAWKRYSAKAGVKPTRLHDLRHTAASQMLIAGVPISIVAERLGCTEGNILRTYRHFIPGSDREAALLMDRMLSGAD